MNTARVILVSVFVSATVTTVVLGGMWLLLTHHPTLYEVLIPEPTTSTDVTDQTSPLTLDPASIPDVVTTAIPAVVSIVISADVPIIERYYEEFNPFDRMFGGGFGFSVPRERQIGTERQEIGGGTGFIVSPEGYLITNRHVVDQDNLEYTVVLNDGTTYPVNVIAKDPMLDIAVLKIEAEDELPYLAFASSESVRLGEPVIAIGNALAEFPNSVSVGVVSGLSRNILATGGRGVEVLDNVIQTDAAINRGNSGGPLLNIYGEVIGVNVAAAGGVENIGFALPAAMVADVFNNVLEHGEIIRPFIGIRYVPVTEELIERNNLPVDYGVLIARGESRTDLAVLPGSPADKAGLEENDIILAIDGIDLNEDQRLSALLRSYNVGDTVNLTVLKDGEMRAVSLTLERLPK